MIKQIIAAASISAVMSVGAGMPSAEAAPIGYVVDGDTLRLANGKYVRLIGIDTPEAGECGYFRAKRAVTRMVAPNVPLLNPITVDNKDGYGRLLRYADNKKGRDIGLTLLRRGLAQSRYDTRDGYDWHPKLAKYIRVDDANPDFC